MIDSINSQFPLPQRPHSQETPLTEEQKNAVEQTLSAYDAQNLTSEDANAIITAFSDAGIKPGRELRDAIADQGFDASQIRATSDLPPPQNDRPQLPKQRAEEISNMLGTMADLVSDKLSESGAEELSEKDKKEIYLQIMEQFRSGQSDSLIDTSA